MLLTVKKLLLIQSIEEPNAMCIATKANKSDVSLNSNDSNVQKNV